MDIPERGYPVHCPPFFLGKDSMGNNTGRNVETAAVNTEKINNSYTLLPNIFICCFWGPLPLIQVDFPF